jgi:L-threonylcarbamoyladenylate synthase
MNEATEMDDAIKILHNGGVLVYPTETAYALGCDATNPRAIRRIYQLKHRERTKPLPVIVSSFAMADRWVFWPRGAKKMAHRFWPGPLTLVLPKKDLTDRLTAGDPTIAIRISSHPVARFLARRLGRPIVSTSANASGTKECYTIEDVEEQFARRTIEGWVNGGRLRPRRPSTIVDWTSGTPKILRQGAVKI